jgi:putative endonuclease
MYNWLKRNWAIEKSTRKIGAEAERLAQNYLEKKGLRLITHNYHCRSGEIDLIMLDGNFLVFVEVRYRKNDIFGSAAESVTGHKQRRLLTTANYFLQSEKSYKDNSCRFDVITVSGQYNPQIEWIKDAFQAAPD